MSAMFQSITPIVGWVAVFAVPNEETLHIPIGAWGMVEYSDDDDGHCDHCGHRESFVAVEALLSDSTGLTTIQ
jgi:hypothetical protein